ncbi:MAG: NAD(P)/FAD-dependent oxidoreductase [Clostridia bacterium]|nr:NAD(P)/FAD-dependent oxidoreductase [Clostridia bacterium]
MKEKSCQRVRYLLGSIGVSPDAADEEVFSRAAEKMKRLGIPSSSLHFRLYKRSVDARKRDDVRLVWTVLVESDAPISPSKCEKLGLRALEEDFTKPMRGTVPISAPPMVVGMGPAGLFAALELAKNGYCPILIDRGDSVEERVKAVERFRIHGILDTESNVQFGAGGAGTFSDGKLVTRIHDRRCRAVLETFQKHGAPDEILTLAKPHIGTDVLRGVVNSMLDEICRLGGKVIYRCKLMRFEELADGTVSVHTTAGDFVCGALVLAIGHSARDTYEYLIGQQYAIEAKPISMGVRVEHLQKEIDSALYGRFAGHPKLGHAEYALSDTKLERGVYTFCMCPGGEVVAAASEAEGLVVNGMSNHARDGRNANAAVLVSVGCEDYTPISGSLALGAIAFQRSVEQRAFRAGGGDYRAPIMTLGDFMNGKCGTAPTRILPSYRDGQASLADFGTVFPSFVTDSLRYAFHSFGKKLEGYDSPDAVLTAAETRTSAPLRILRDRETMTAIGHPLIYPCGEGAGYAGGITSAATDGLRVAEVLMERFAPCEK